MKTPFIIKIHTFNFDPRNLNILLIKSKKNQKHEA
jgi:hypothetical protein